MTTTCCPNSTASETLRLPFTAEGASRGINEGIARLARFLLGFEEMLDRARQRRAMRDLDGHMLRDIGLSAADVEREASKPFWRS